MDNLIAFDKKHLWHPYTNSPTTIENHLITAANGVYLTLDNKQVIDGMSSWWATIHGYNHPVLNTAITDQLNNMAHIMFGGLTHTPAIELANKLIKITPKPLTQVFFSDSGSIAVEVALKMALQYQQALGNTSKNKFITPLGGYHGDSFGAMSVCDPLSGMHNLFTGILAKHYFVKQPNDIDAIDDLAKTLAKNHNNIAAMILEPIIQGAGGMRIYSASYLIAVRELCTKYNILLIIDEIATGFGRTGKLFASQYANIDADILCLGKALTGGYLSLAATITTAKISTTIGVLMHGPTFMANPLAISVANASIDLLLQTKYIDKIANIEKILAKELLPLKRTKNVADVRILGAIAIVEMVADIDIIKTQDKLIANGVWLRPYGKLLYTMPPFIITNSQLLQITDAIKLVVETTALNMNIR